MGNQNLKTMKLLIVTLILALAGVSMTAPSCVATNYCMGCDASIANKCVSCFNWKAGTVGPRYLASDTCTNKRSTSLITDCKIYSGTSGNTVGDNCMVCDSKDWYNMTTYGTAAYACSNTSLSSTTCKSTISNCEQSVCLTTAASTFYTGCRMCKSGYAPGGYNSTSTMMTTCGTTGKITNCDYHSNSGSLQNSTTATCRECWHSYYWNATVCKLKSGLMAVGAAMLALFYLTW